MGWKFGPGVRLAAVAMLAALACSPQDTGSAASGPPILLITVDGLVSADLEPFGGEQAMPNLARLIDQGAAWPEALSAVPMSRPAVATYLTGLTPDRHGVRDDLFATLPESLPTLAQGLTDAGYSTAGFPDSAFFSERSGLWRGFEIVDRPPPMAVGASRWLPRVRPTAQTAESFKSWLDSVESDRPWFAWVHLSHPWIGQLKQQYFQSGDTPEPAAGTGTEDEEVEILQIDDVASYADALTDFDNLLGQLLDRVDARGDGDAAWILLGGTLADQRRDENNPALAGAGYSLDARAVEVPVIVRAPVGTSLRETTDDVWSPDLAATIAAAAGIEPAVEAEGIPLGEPAADRVRFAWSWATLDQLGWRALGLARDDSRQVVVGEPSAVAADPAAVEDLVAALEARPVPQRVGLPSDVVAALIDESGLEAEIDPLPLDGRDVDDPAKRKRIAGLVWQGRAGYQSNDMRAGGQAFFMITRRMDPLNYVGWLDRGHMMSLRWLDQGHRATGKAVQLRPDDAEAWHWYAHSRWSDSWEDAEKILLRIQPYLANQADVLYDLACTHSLAGELEVSADYLDKAYRAGFRNRNHIAADPDLRNLRESEHFSRVMQQFH